MKTVLAILFGLISSLASAGQMVVDNGGAVLGFASTVHCPTGANCTITAGRTLNTSSMARLVTSSTNTTLDSTYCGATIVNSAASTIHLPAASTVLGCQYSFVTANASSFNISPVDYSTDKIAPLATAGNSIYTATVGNSIVVKAVATGIWSAVGKEQGTWTAATAH